MEALPWDRIKELFDAARALPGADRDRFLDQACSGDSALRQELDSLLDGAEIETQELAKPVSRRLENSTRVPERIGRYRVLHRLGGGGMGVVYLGQRDDQEYRQRVAIKVLRRELQSDEQLGRFRQERQILASLDHESIARLLDGGTTSDGLPYLVMEYVDGTPIDRYCDVHRLDVRQRLELFRQICDAVHFAHQNLVVHRDLKPSNILVTARGVPKLLDFGIAKLINPELASDQADPTRIEQRVLTAQYASPEQVRGDPITTTSDVYGLGVLLYQLLTGQRPYRVDTTAELELIRAICESQPERPSTAITRGDRSPSGTDAGKGHPAGSSAEDLSRLRGSEPERLQRSLSGDLDNIVLMALRKEPQRRYPSVRELSEDLGRHLRGMPVVARPNTLGYRLGKFVRRNRLGVAAAAIVILSALAAVAGIAWQGQVAKAERERAERRFDDVRHLANSFLFEIHDAIQNLPGSMPARQLVVAKALEYLSSLASESSEDPSLDLEIATAYAKVGDIQWNRYYSNLGDVQGAYESQRTALRLRERVVAGADADEVRQKATEDLALSHVRLGDLEAERGRPVAALASYELSRDTRVSLLRSQPGNRRLRHELAVSHQRIGDTLGNPRFSTLGDRPAALAAYDRMQQIFRELAESDPSDDSARFSLSIGYEKIGDMERGAEQWAEALEQYRLALELRQSLSSDDPADARLQRDVGVAHAKAADMLELLGDVAAARQGYAEALDRFEPLHLADPEDRRAHSDVLWALGRLAELSGSAGLRAEQRRLAVRLISILRSRAERSDAGVDDLNSYAWTLLTIEPADLRSPATALRVATSAVARSEEPRLYLLETLASAHFQTGDRERALARIDQAIALSSGDDPVRDRLEQQRALYASR